MQCLGYHGNSTVAARYQHALRPDIFNHFTDGLLIVVAGGVINAQVTAFGFRFFDNPFKNYILVHVPGNGIYYQQNFRL